MRSGSPLSYSPRERFVLMSTVTRQNIALVRRWFDEVWNQGQMEKIAELAAPDAVAHGHAPYDIGMDQFKVFYQSVRSAFPDIHLAIDFTVAESDKVVARWTTQGRLLPGQVGTGQRTLVYAGPITTPLLAETLALRIERARARHRATARS